MKPLMWLGSVVAAIGILALLIRGGIHYSTNDELPNVGSAHVNVKRERVLVVPPLAGGLTLAAGIGIMLLAARR